MPALDAQGLDLIFSAARTHHAWLDKPVDDGLLEQIYQLAAWGPTAFNAQPMRVVFLKSAPAKEKLLPALNPGNVPQVQAAPVTAIIAMDSRFFEHLPRLAPQATTAPALFAGNAALADTAAMRNSSLGGAYLMIAARALGLDVGPMSGFDIAKVDAAFFPDGRYKTNFLCNLGYGDAAKLYPRADRLRFDEACQIA